MHALFTPRPKPVCRIRCARFGPLVVLCLGVAIPVAAAVGGSPAAIDVELLAGMKARSIGPAGMSGRVATIDAVESDPDLVYVGAATGGSGSRGTAVSPSARSSTTSRWPLSA